MRLLKVWDTEYPWDVRAEKIMRSLSGAGHAVHLVARNRSGELLEEALEEATVHRLRPWGFLGSRFDALSQFPAFINPRWLHLIWSVGRNQVSQAIIVRDLPLAITAAWAGKLLGIPVILDMAENYPAMIRDSWLGGRQGRLDFLVRNPSFVAAVERWALEVVDHVFVVVEESGSRLVGMGVNPKRITVVSNTPWPSKIPNESELAGRGPSGPLRLVYLGQLERPRGLETVLRGLSVSRDTGAPPTHLAVIGSGRDETLIRRESDRLGLSENEVTFHGFLPHTLALEIVSGSDVGIVPHLATAHANTTIPNKLFDYMSQGLPVITSDAKPSARVVRETGAGVVFRSDDPIDFSKAILRMQDPGSRRMMAMRGRRAVRERYNWSVDEARLLEAVEHVVNGGVGGADAP